MNLGRLVGLNGTLWNKYIAKKRKFNKTIKNILIYGCEIQRLFERKIEATKMNAMKQLVRIPQMDEVKNNEVR